MQNRNVLNFSSWLDPLLKKIKINGLDYTVIGITERQGEAFETLADIRNAKKYLNWSPSIMLNDWLKRNI